MLLTVSEQHKHIACMVASEMHLSSNLQRLCRCCNDEICVLHANLAPNMAPKAQIKCCCVNDVANRLLRVCMDAYSEVTDHMQDVAAAHSIACYHSYHWLW